jgi:4-amino-4-deoxy-L-arabinose transferase-like glycosyltransferase
MRALTPRGRTPWLLGVAALMLAGAALRIPVAGQALFADELSTYWIVTAHGLGGVLSTVHSDAEITPPLSFVATWATAQLGHAPELIRLPSLVAGVLCIPLVYAVGERTVGRAAGLVAAALTAGAPFMVYYSGEARAYALLMLCVLLSTLTLLRALEGSKTGWWVLYAAATCAAVLTHYTSVFVLAAQLAWALWAHPERRRAVILANAGAVVAFLPWITGFVNDLTSPTAEILSALSPFTPHDVRLVLEHWSLGYPYTWVAPLRDLPGTPALVALALGLLLALVGVAVRAQREGLRRPRPGLVLVVALALAAPLGEMLVSAVGTNLFGVRNLAASWPGLALALAALLTAPAPRLRLAASALAVCAFATGGVQMLGKRFERPDYVGAARYVDATAAPGDVVVDATAVLSPGPLSPIDAALRRPHRIVRGAAPAERDHPFGFGDPVVPLEQAIAEAVAAARDGRVLVVTSGFPQRISGIERRTAPMRPKPPPAYRRAERRVFGGIASTEVEVYAPR